MIAYNAAAPSIAAKTSASLGAETTIATKATTLKANATAGTKG